LAEIVDFFEEEVGVFAVITIRVEVGIGLGF
jgi:hypothetical protein